MMQTLDERTLTALHESAHAVVAMYFNLRIRRAHIAPPRGSVSFSQDGRFARLAPVANA